MCKDCSGPPPAEGESGQENCKAVDYKKHYVSNYYSVRGAKQMKAELAAHGPISCGVHATDKFEKTYKGGIYKEKLGPFAQINHEISVIGYGKDAESGEEYWIGRNSWGNYWGEYGFFKVPIGGENLLIERDCVAGIPTYDKPNAGAEFIN